MDNLTPSPFPTSPDTKFWDEVYDLADKYGFSQCAVFVSHKVGNDTDEWAAQSNVISKGMIDHIEYVVEHMREQLDGHEVQGD